MSEMDINKISSDIEDLKGKRQSLLRSLQNDIDEIESLMNQQFCQIGQKAYGLAEDGTDTLESLQADFESINRHRAEREGKLSKMADIAARYDEEITLLEKLIPEAPATPSCTACGAQYRPGRDIFCMSCGRKLG